MTRHRAPPIQLSAAEARAFLIAHHHLGRPRFRRGAEGARQVLRELRCIQLDPLDVVGTNADLVAMARVEGLVRGDVYRALFPHHAFEHFAKERCLLPADAFPYYRARAAETPWWSLAERLKRLPPGVIESVLEEGVLEEVVVEGGTRSYLAPAGFRSRRLPAPDGKVRLLGPLDPMIWDRALIKQAFGFDYVWEVYKPAPLRRWGWYVVPLLQGDRFVGRVEAVVEGGVLKVKKLWAEKDAAWSNDAVDEALARHAAQCGAERVVRPKRVLGLARTLSTRPVGRS